MFYSKTSLAAAIHTLAALASTSAHALTYQNEPVPEVLYQSTTNPNRAAEVSSATSITGCNAGLITADGAYVCRSAVLVSKGGTIPDPVVAPPVVVASGGNGGGGGRDGGNGTGDGGPRESTLKDREGRDVIDGSGRAVGASGGSGGGGGGGRVICTHFYAKGEIAQDVWRADLAYTKEHLSETTVRGYHAWAVGYVKLMRKSKLAEDIMRPIALHRAQELAYKMGVLEKGSLRGKLARLALEPLCYAIGTCVGARDYMALWKDQPQVLKLIGALA